jgi:FAD/FMN-containing dehydrogenase
LKTARQAAAASKALHVWQTTLTGGAVPPDLGHQALLVHTTGPGDKDLAPYFVVRGVFNGSEAHCRRALEPLLALMPNVKDFRDIWRRGGYRELNQYLLTYPTEFPPNVPASARSLAKSHIVARPPSVKEWAALVDFYRANPNTDNFIGLEAYGGAINAVAPDATAFWHRKAALDVFVFSFWLQEDAREAAERCVRAFDKIVAPLSNGHSYQNYPNRQNRNFGKLYFGGNLTRLRKVKRAYDPDNFFAFPQGLGEA